MKHPSLEFSRASCCVRISWATNCCQLITLCVGPKQNFQSHSPTSSRFRRLFCRLWSDLFEVSEFHLAIFKLKLLMPKAFGKGGQFWNSKLRFLKFRDCIRARKSTNQVGKWNAVNATVWRPCTQEGLPEGAQSRILIQMARIAL